MTTPQASASAVPYRRAHRPADRRVLGGVAAGLSDHLGLPVLWVRVAFVVATVFNGVGVLAYVGLWRFLPLKEASADFAPGIGAATRSGRRTESALSKLDVLQAAALLAIGAGLVLVQQLVGWGPSPRYIVPLLLAGVGVVLLWRMADDTRGAAVRRQGVLGAIVGDGGAWQLVRLFAGLALVTAAIAAFVVEQVGISELRDVIVATALALTGAGLLVGPWVYSLSRELAAERRERVRTQERADMAAHLHDSVLQTLALLQRNADDSRTVSRLARQQERDLRDWLYGGSERTSGTLGTDLTAAAHDVETAHNVVVEVVCVGDGPSLPALVRAAREAMTNAARHSGVDRVDVYAEVGPRGVDVFVRDRGVGFDPDRIATDRMGVRESILARMERHGGRAEVRSTPGGGTEVRLWMPPVREDDSHDQA